MEGVTQVLETLKCLEEKKATLKKRESYTGMHVVRESEGGEDEEKEQERESELHVGETHKPKKWA